MFKIRSIGNRRFLSHEKSCVLFFAGVIDVFLDRRLTLDDGRGLGQGVMDNLEIISTFELLFESRHTVCELFAFDFDLSFL